MIPSHWPRWSVILIGFALVIFTILIALVLEPAAQAVAPRPVPTPTVFRLAYAAPLSGDCVECHTDETALVNSGAPEAEVVRLLITSDEVVSLHGRLGCVTCHQGNGETDDKEAAHEGLVPNPTDYREAGKVCLACHADVRTDIPEKNIHTPHQRILWGIYEEQEICACSNCHGPVAHGVAPVGTHEGLAAYCIDCHEEKGVPPERLACAGCHIGPHDIADALDCEVCHTSTDTWSKVELAVHPMALNGRHGELACFECHDAPDFRTLSGFTCESCHQKPHDFGNGDCAQCHADGGTWEQVDVTTFDHTAIWPYFTGAHTTVACEGCHFEGYQGLSPDCGACHTLNPDTCAPDQKCTDCHRSDLSWSDVQG